MSMTTMTGNRSMALTGGASLALAFALGIAGCGGSQKPDAETPASVSEGEGGDQLGESEGSSKPVAAAPKKPERKITQEQKVNFQQAVSTYEKKKKSGAVRGADCRDLAGVFERIADDNPTLIEARFNQGAILLDCGDERGAMRAWETLTDGARKYGLALNNLGYIAWKNGDTMRAETLFSRAIDLDPKAVDARNNLAQILRDKARRAASPDDKKQYIGQAVGNLRRVLAVDSNNLQAYSTLAFIYFEMNMLELAKLVGKQAVDRAEEIATGKSIEEQSADEGKVTTKKGKGKKGKEKEEASFEEKKATEVKSSGDTGTGYTEEMKGHIATTFNTLGLVELKKRNVTQALGNFRKAIELNPDYMEARLNLGSLSLGYRDYKTAEESFRAVVAKQPKNYDAVIGLGVALRGNKKIDGAEEQYLAAQKLDPANPASYFNLGLIYQDYRGAMGDKPALQKAQQYYRDFLSRATDATPEGRKEEASKRIKNIDELFVALEEMRKMQIEADEIQRKAEQQQKEMEEKMKAQDAAEKAAAAAAPPPPPPPPPPADEGGKKGKKGRR